MIKKKAASRTRLPLAEEILWEKRHYLGEDTPTLIHMILTLHYYQIQKYKIKSSKNSIAVNHCNLITFLTTTGFSPDSCDFAYNLILLVVVGKAHLNACNHEKRYFRYFLQSSE